MRKEKAFGETAGVSARPGQIGPGTTLCIICSIGKEKEEELSCRRLNGSSSPSHQPDNFTWTNQSANPVLWILSRAKLCPFIGQSVSSSVSCPCAAVQPLGLLRQTFASSWFPLPPVLSTIKTCRPAVDSQVKVQAPFDERRGHVF